MRSWQLINWAWAKHAEKQQSSEIPGREEDQNVYLQALAKDFNMYLEDQGDESWFKSARPI